MLKKKLDQLFKNFKKEILPSGNKNNQLFTNKDLLNELEECFSTNLEIESVGNRMLYPMAFNTLMHPEDYEHRKPALSFVIQEIVNNFYKLINQRKDEYPNIEPTARNWSFQFSPTEVIQLEGNTTIDIVKGKPYIIAQLYTTVSNNSKSTTNTRISYKPKNSDTFSTVNLNQQAFSRLNIIAESIFEFPFDKNLSPIKQPPQPLGEPIAELTYSESGSLIHFQMVNNEIFISGNQDSRKETWLLKLNKDEVINNQVSIRYDKNRDRFEISAYGSLRVGEKTIPISSGGNVQWQPLPRNAKLLISNLIPMDFKAKI